MKPAKPEVPLAKCLDPPMVMKTDQHLPGWCTIRLDVYAMQHSILI